MKNEKTSTQFFEDEESEITIEETFIPLEDDKPSGISAKVKALATENRVAAVVTIGLFGGTVGGGAALLAAVAFEQLVKSLPSYSYLLIGAAGAGIGAISSLLAAKSVLPDSNYTKLNDLSDSSGYAGFRNSFP